MWIHRICGTLILLITMTVAFLTLARKEWTITSGPHEILGVVILSLVLLIVLGGVFNRSMMQRLRWRSSLMFRIKMGHRLFGYLMLLLSEIAILTGSLKYASFHG
jgi:hypothetical protein